MKKILWFVTFIFLVSSLVQASEISEITIIKSPYESCLGSYQEQLKQLNSYQSNIKKLSLEEQKEYLEHREQMNIFQKEYENTFLNKEFNQEILCQYNNDKESCKQCINTKNQQIKWSKTKRSLINTVSLVLLLLTITGFFYLLIKMIRKPEVKYKALKITILIIATMIILFILSLIILIHPRIYY